MIWGSIVKGIAGAALDKIAPEVARHYREKQEQEHLIDMEKLKGKQAWEMAQTARAEASEGRDHEWEILSLTQHSKGWKDEFVLLVVSIPAVLAFTPFVGFVQKGFDALGMTPYWYQGMLVSIYFAVYGIRAIRRDNEKKDLIKRFHELEVERSRSSQES